MKVFKEVIFWIGVMILIVGIIALACKDTEIGIPGLVIGGIIVYGPRLINWIKMEGMR
jgi:hypothetical protein